MPDGSPLAALDRIATRASGVAPGDAVVPRLPSPFEAPLGRAARVDTPTAWNDETAERETSAPSEPAPLRGALPPPEPLRSPGIARPVSRDGAHPHEPRSNTFVAPAPIDAGNAREPIRVPVPDSERRPGRQDGPDGSARTAAAPRPFDAPFAHRAEERRPRETSTGRPREPMAGGARRVNRIGEGAAPVDGMSRGPVVRAPALTTPVSPRPAPPLESRLSLRQAAAPERPVVHVTIGRVEIRASLPSSASDARSTPRTIARATSELSGYLGRRAQGSRS